MHERAPDDTFGSAWCSRTRRSRVRGRRPRELRRDHPPVRPLDGDRRALPRRGGDVGRPRLLGHGADGAAQPAPAPAAELGVELPLPGRGGDELDGDLVVAADGVEHVPRRQAAPSGRRSTAGRKYVCSAPTWCSARSSSSSAETGKACLQVHGYPYSDERTTFIVETRRRRGGPPASTRAVARLLRAVRRRLDGHRLIANSRTGSTSPCATRPARGNVVLLGDAAHTAHFSIGRGPSSRWRTRSRWPGDPQRRQRARGHSRPTRPSAGRSWSRRSAPPRARSVVRGARRYIHQERVNSRSTCSRAAAGSPTASCSSATPRSSLGDPRGRRCSRRTACAASSCQTASSCRRWTCTRR